jgi:hypothetical protein
MVRARLAAVVVAAGLGLAGCSSLSNLNPFGHRHRSCPCEEAPCDMGGPVGSDGPVLGDYGPVVVPPGPGPVVTAPAPLTAMPPLGPAPRLTPQPTAPTMPYTPTN